MLDSRNINYFMGLLLSSTIDGGMFKMFEHANLETRMPYATHHFFVKKNSQPTKAHLNEEVVCTTCMRGGICVHIWLSKSCCKHTTTHIVDMH
jgi:hypothetical protein